MIWTLLGILTIGFVLLKVSGNTRMSWLMVLSPLWGPFAAYFLFILALIFVGMVGMPR